MSFFSEHTAYILMVRFRHLHPMDTSGRANVGIRRTTSQYMILVDFYEFDIRLRARCRTGCEYQRGSTSASNPVQLIQFGQSSLLFIIESCTRRPHCLNFGARRNKKLKLRLAIPVQILNANHLKHRAEKWEPVFGKSDATTRKQSIAPQKWEPVFGKKDAAPRKQSQSDDSDHRHFAVMAQNRRQDNPKMKPSLYIINGPNLNLLGQREPDIYGQTSLADIESALNEQASALDLDIRFLQSNHEGVLVDWIHEARMTAAGVILNAGAYTHTSIAILDALKALSCPIIEVHLSNPARRESFRHLSYPSLVAHGIIAGFGAMSYELALNAMVKLLQKSKTTS